MRKIILSILLIAATTSCLAQSTAARFTYLRKYDVPKQIMKMPKGNTAEFWRDRHLYDKKIDKALHARSKAAKNARSECASIMQDIARNVRPNEYYDKKYSDLLEYLYSIFHFRSIDPYCEVHIYPSDEFNAGTYPSGYIELNTGLIESCTREEIVAVLAHEMQHFVGKHTLNHIYAVNKKERNNRMWAELGGAMAATAVAYSGAYSGNAQYQQNVLAASVAFDRDADKATGNYRMRYSREQEIEADIAAYRFLQFIGLDPNIWIRVLDKLAVMEGGRRTSKKDNHPSATYRKNVLLTIEKYDKSK